MSVLIDSLRWYDALPMKLSKVWGIYELGICLLVLKFSEFNIIFWLISTCMNQSFIHLFIIIKKLNIFFY